MLKRKQAEISPAPSLPVVCVAAGGGEEERLDSGVQVYFELQIPSPKTSL